MKKLTVSVVDVILAVLQKITECLAVYTAVSFDGTYLAMWYTIFFKIDLKADTFYDRIVEGVPRFFDIPEGTSNIEYLLAVITTGILLNWYTTVIIRRVLKRDPMKWSLGLLKKCMQRTVVALCWFFSALLMYGPITVVNTCYGVFLVRIVYDERYRNSLTVEQHASGVLLFTGVVILLNLLCHFLRKEEKKLKEETKQLMALTK